MKLPTLYRKRIVQKREFLTYIEAEVFDIYSLEVQGPTIYFTQGILDSHKSTTSTTLLIGSDIGTEYEKTPERTAELEAMELWCKKKSKGWEEDLEALRTKNKED